MRRTYQSESGQALVLIVLGIVGMLGFAALAIDGGRIYTDRRNMQNASDTSSLTGAGSFASYMTQNGIYWKNWSCSDTTSWFVSAKAQAYSDAINRAASNGYAVDADISDPDGANGITITCGSESHTGFTDYYIDVTTYITADTPSSLAQFVFGGPLRQTVASTARIRPQTSGGFGNAIVALNPANCDGNNNGALFDGNNQVLLNGGGVFSNGCFRAGGTSLLIDVNSGGTNTYMSNLIISGSPTINPPPQNGTEPLPDDVFTIPPPDCSGLPDATLSNSMNPGVYPASLIPNGNYTMNPGLYCFNGRFRINGGTLTGDGVTLYFVSGGFEVQGNPVIDLRAPSPVPDPSPAIPNLLIYLAEGNTSQASLLGNAGSFYAGTVYAPDGSIEVGGTSDATNNPSYSTQLIGWDVFVHGNAQLDLNFDDALVYQFPPRLDLQE